jgi:hypothetical protein
MDRKMIAAVIVAVLAMVAVVFVISAPTSTGQVVAASTSTILPGMIGGC